jgi:hypothetical protein
MVVCGSYMFGCSASKDLKNNNDRWRSPTYLLAYLQTPSFKKLMIYVEQGRVVTTLNVIKH